MSASMDEKWFLQFELLNCITSDIGHSILRSAQLSKWTSGSQIVRQLDVADQIIFCFPVRAEPSSLAPKEHPLASEP